MVVALFPGHTGKDSGAIDGVDPLTHDNYHTIESVVTSLITSKIAGYLQSLNIQYVIGLGDFESRIMVTAGCDVGIAIHADSHCDQRISGYHVIYYPGSTKGYPLGKSVDKALNGADMNRARPVHPRKDLYILRKTVFPCILVEAGFISNAEEESQLLRDDYQNRVAFAITSGLLNWM